MTTETYEPVGSSHIMQVAYDSESREMEIAFADGSIYVYSAVPPETFIGFREAGSAGQYFHRAVKNRFAYAPK